MNLPIFIISGPSGSGKGTIIKELLKKYPNLVSLSVSVTTRKKRETETDGIEYHFISPQEFQNKIAGGELLEYQEVYKDLFYGTSFSEIERIHSEKKIPILEIDVFGALNAKKHFEEIGVTAYLFFVYPGIPLEDVLRERLTNRGTEDFTERLKKACTEFSQRSNFDIIIMNRSGELDTAVLLLSRFTDLIHAHYLNPTEKSENELARLLDSNEQLKEILSDQNMYYAGLAVNHPPNVTDAVVQYATQGGASAYRANHPK